MIKKVAFALGCIITGLISYSFYTEKDLSNCEKHLLYCHTQIKKTLNETKDTCLMPRSMGNKQTSWHKVNIYDWTSGFWPGILWYDYEQTRDEKIKEQAIRSTECLQPLVNPKSGSDHDIGFQIFCSYGNAYRLTGDKRYKQIIMSGAEKLSRLYNPAVGTILSWPGMRNKMGWPHNTIIDNMMNLEILFWTAENGGEKKYYDIAVNHARVTKENHFRKDGSSYHVAVYDTLNGKFIKGVTNQGYGDNTMWARGQAWAIYGYTMVYRYTRDKSFLRFAEKVTDIYLERLPEDYIPYWDFDAPALQNEPKDASAAAIVASALFELAQLEDKKRKAEEYQSAAVTILRNLSSNKYRSGTAKPSFLNHCTGNYPSGYEIDASINYADYYYIEALLRYKKRITGLPVTETLEENIPIKLN